MLLLQTDRNTLLAPLNATIGVVERRHTLPILSNLLLEKKAGVLTLLATDLELQVSTTLDNVGKGEDFAITVAARKLFDIVRALPDVDGKRTALFGSSMGGGHALIVAADGTVRPDLSHAVIVEI